MHHHSNTRPAFSFEFFPPKNPEGAERLRRARARLTALDPAYFSVTFGAGGSTRDRTLETVLEIQNEAAVAAAPHISCISSSRAQLLDLLTTYRDHGVRRLVALRGDLPSGTGVGGGLGEFRYAAELVAFIREQFGDHFTIEVAAYPEFHPEAVNAEKDLEHFRQKVAAGADAAITQYFYNPDAYLAFVERVRAMGVDIPIVPGIMPITNYSQLARFSDACGAEIPRYIRKRLEAYGDDTASIRAFGVEVVTRLCQRLLDDGAPGLHFYSMNQAAPSEAIWNNLGLAQPR
ncbi:methylenetetrahydrofolate reductase [NAD(P)H] [Thioalkalivibrio paradoxus]|uniref:Methylenetetrahydrofolate reductase n=1 Tax=Thioalkalivibrio paradoxus ARh 1 TaxID=713585 RepID=W0DLQ6_9GAMM|nr:methylenetetrahydrofolate reductase [NAD(P)H] [Thioalkalivibrio paradoxus]AHE99534.1 5,10-methylenetetrahydrofolate reductase [Thioalkalivibrio paradoxus ARh 1]